MEITGKADTGQARTAARVQLRRMLDGLVATGAVGALAQYRDEAGTWNGVSGVAELGSRRPMAADGWFRIGSLTKTFTAAVILQLVGEGRLSLADTVERWLPGLVPGGDRISLRQLLDHTGGLYNYTDALEPAGIVRDRFRQRRPEEVVALATGYEPRFEPGTSRAYCNTGYILLGMVIEKASGSSYEAEIARRVLHPLEMRRTLVPADELIPEPHAHCYLSVDEQLVDLTAYNPSQAWSAGGMISTADDLNRFYRALLTGDLLAPAPLAQMLAPMPTPVEIVDGGLGVFRVRLPGGVDVWGKDGGFFGCHTVSFHTVDATRQLTVFMTTTSITRPPTHELLMSIADVFAPA